MNPLMNYGTNDTETRWIKTGMQDYRNNGTNVGITTNPINNNNGKRRKVNNSYHYKVLNKNCTLSQGSCRYIQMEGKISQKAV